MERPATWKVVTVGAALTGLSVLGAGAAGAATADPAAAPASVTVDATQFVPFDINVDDLWNVDTQFYSYSGGSWNSWGS